jgi:hypothetical protein
MSILNLLKYGLRYGDDILGAARNVYGKNPYVKGYMDIMSGKRGWKQGAAGWWGSSLGYGAAQDISDLILPSKVQEDTVVKDLSSYGEFESGIEQEGGPPLVIKKPKIIPLPDKTDASENEEALQKEALTSNGNQVQTDKATVDATNNPSTQNIESDAVNRVKAYKDIVRQFLGAGDEGMRMQKAALLMNVGGMLMAGKSEDPGLKGFVEIIGQTAMQTAPMMFQMGVEQGKSDREIGQAALQLYMEDMQDQSERTGDFVGVWANDYERTEDGGIAYDRFSGAPIVKNRRLVGQYRANSNEMNYFLDENNTLGIPFYTFQPSSGTAAGMTGMSAQGDTSTMMLTDAGKDAMLRSGSYINSALNSMADSILPMMIENRDLIGVKGWATRKFGPSAYAISEIANGFKAAFGPNSVSQITDDEFVVNRSSQLGEYYESLIPGTTAGNEMDQSTEQLGGMTYGVLENATPDQFIKIGGETLPVYVDTKGKYGVKGGRYLTRGALEKMLFDPRRGELQIFETTLGLALARKRQPTGRMLADVLKRSFEETQTTGLFNRSNMPQVVIGNYIKLYKELYEGMAAQLHTAGYIPNEEARQNQYQKVSALYTIPGAQNMANIYYNLRRSDPSYSTYSFNIPGPGIDEFSAFMGGNTAVITADDQQTNKSIGDTFNHWMNILDQ